jgi:hypothetical protein
VWAFIQSYEMTVFSTKKKYLFVEASPCGGVMYFVHASVHYREQGERARRLSAHHGDEIRDRLLHLARCYDEVADDLTASAPVRHPEMLRRADRKFPDDNSLVAAVPMPAAQKARL